MNYATTLHRRFEGDGVRYVYVAPAASILRLDDVSAAVIDAFPATGRDEATWLATLPAGPQADEARAAFRDLVAMGIIRRQGEMPVPVETAPPQPYPLATLVLNVTNKCNLACTYCYEYGEDKIADAKKADGTPKASMMTPQIARDSVDMLFRQSDGRGEVTLTFFGGETLLNFGAIRAAVSRAEELAATAKRRVNFALTTNATLLDDEISEYLIGHRFGVNISVDGAKEEHDRHRTFKSGLGSYETIVPRIRRHIERNRAARGRPVGARVTLTTGFSGLRGIYDHLVRDIGFDEAGFAPVTSAPGRDYALSDASYGRLLSEFADLAVDYTESALRNERHGFSNLNDLLRELHLGINKAHPCGAGLGLLGVSTEGELGLCHRFVESGKHEVGSVSSGIDELRRSTFLAQSHVSKKIACHDCFARPTCAGGCYHEAYVRYADPTAPNLHYCDWIRAWTDLGLRTYALIANRNPAFFARFEGAS